MSSAIRCVSISQMVPGGGTHNRRADPLRLALSLAVHRELYRYLLLTLSLLRATLASLPPLFVISIHFITVRGVRPSGATTQPERYRDCNSHFIGHPLYG